jgi:uncharacterized membrane protein YfcA
MTGPLAKYSSGLLGLALAAYALTGLATMRLPPISRGQERWFGPAAGAVTGIIGAATGVFTIPGVPYLQAIGLEKEELVQALGLSFTVSTIALAVNLTLAGAINVSIAGAAFGALIMACGGMWIGQSVRLGLRPETFRRVFFVGLLLLGVHLATRLLS